VGQGPLPLFRATAVSIFRAMAASLFRATPALLFRAKVAHLFRAATAPTGLPEGADAGTFANLSSTSRRAPQAVQMKFVPRLEESPLLLLSEGPPLAEVVPETCDHAMPKSALRSQKRSKLSSARKQSLVQREFNRSAAAGWETSLELIHFNTSHSTCSPGGYSELCLSQIQVAGTILFQVYDMLHPYGICFVPYISLRSHSERGKFPHTVGEELISLIPVSHTEECNGI